VAAEALRVREALDRVEELHERRGPAVREDERAWMRARTALVDEVDAVLLAVLASHRGGEVAEAVEPAVLRAPVEAVSPVLEQVAHVGAVSAPFPPFVAGRLLRPARPLEARSQLRDLLVRHMDGERFGGSRCHAGDGSTRQGGGSSGPRSGADGW